MKKSTVIYGPPGTGKSTEIIRRMREAIANGTDTNRIGLCSFTKAAAHELARRVGVRPGQHISTLHSYAFRLCDMVREQVVDRNKLVEFSKISKIETTGANIYDQETLGVGDYYLATYGYMRSTLMTSTAEAWMMGPREGNVEEFAYFVKCYDQWKAANGYMDFSDMLTMALDKPAPDLDILFLDEAQDFSPSQWLLIESWVPHIDEVVLALDDDQTLYKFTGADPMGGPNFERKYGSERVVLDKSYRVPGEIHKLATEFIQRVEHRVEKKYDPVAPGGTIRRSGGFGTTPLPDRNEDTLILYRNHSLSTDIRDWLMDRGIPFLTDNGYPGPLQSYLANAILCWESLKEDIKNMGQPMLTPAQWANMRRCAHPRYVKAFTTEQVDDILHVSWSLIFKMPSTLATYYNRLLRTYGTIKPATKIHLSTIHGAKGREADRVILLNAMSNKTAEAFAYDPDPEYRAFYVGVTRAKKVLDIVYGESGVGGL